MRTKRTPTCSVLDRGSNFALLERVLISAGAGSREKFGTVFITVCW